MRAALTLNRLAGLLVQGDALVVLGALVLGVVLAGAVDGLLLVLQDCKEGPPAVVVVGGGDGLRAPVSAVVVGGGDGLRGSNRNSEVAMRGYCGSTHGSHICIRPARIPNTERTVEPLTALWLLPKRRNRTRTAPFPRCRCMQTPVRSSGLGRLHANPGRASLKAPRIRPKAERGRAAARYKI